MEGNDNHETSGGWVTPVYDELRRLARSFLRREPYEDMLSATGLVHEAWLRIARQNQSAFRNRSHCFGAAAVTMRRILVDRARGRIADKRRGMHVTLTAANDAAAPETIADDRLLALDAALEKLARIDERLVRVIECRFFVGLSIRETAAALGISHATVSEDWRVARGWLRRALASAPVGAAAVRGREGR